jgi:hypothetical protein
MCMFDAPKIPTPPPPAQMQAMQMPKEMQGNKRNRPRRRGMWANIFTSPQGLTSIPSVTGAPGGTTGG